MAAVFPPPPPRPGFAAVPFSLGNSSERTSVQETNNGSQDCQAVDHDQGALASTELTEHNGPQLPPSQGQESNPPDGSKTEKPPVQETAPASQALGSQPTETTEKQDGPDEDCSH
ncbi:uncharacterized protein KZ484_023640 [Pholidichthys leucotaenia]